MLFMNFYFEKSLQNPIGDRLLRLFCKILFFKMLLNRMNKKVNDFALNSQILILKNHLKSI